MVHITSLVMKEIKFNHYSIISLCELSVAMATKPRGISPKQHLYKIRVESASVVLEMSLKNPFLIECCHGNQTKRPLVKQHIQRVNNHPMIKTAKYGSHRFTFSEENHFPIISLRELSVAMITKPRGRSS